MLQEAEERRRAEEGRLAAGQDLDVRRMELEAQRRRLEQVILFRFPASHPAFSTGLFKQFQCSILRVSLDLIDLAVVTE